MHVCRFNGIIVSRENIEDCDSMDQSISTINNLLGQLRKRKSDTETVDDNNII